MLASIKPPTLGLDDFPIWKFFNGNFFSIKLGYQALLVEESIIILSPNFLFLWRWQFLPKVQPFLWKYSHKNFLLMLKGNIMRVSYQDECPCCLQALEPIMHALRYYEVVKELWPVGGIYSDGTWSLEFLLYYGDFLVGKF